MSFDNLILIMARLNGTEEISRQNLRLVNGKPLLYYVINTALKFKNALVVVSTESEEIKYLAMLYGAKVIDRPKSLTKDTARIEDIAIHSLRKLNSEGHNFKKCLIIHPHFPLISINTIGKFFDLLKNDVKTIFGHEENSIQEESYKVVSKLNNIIKLKFLNEEIIKTKKIVCFDCMSFYELKEFTQPYFSIEIPADEIFSPRSYHEFASLESMIKKKKILVRVDGSKKIGLGHVYNMLTILNDLRNEEILVVMNSKKNLGKSKFKEYLYEVKQFSSENQLLKIIKKFQPDIILNDVLDTDRSYMEKLKFFQCPIVNFEDIGNGRKLADLVFNPIFISNKSLKNEYYGPKFACVRDEFRIWQRKDVNKKVKQIIISFGGTDPTNKTEKVLKIINSMRLNQVKYKVVLGIGNTHKKRINSLIQNMIRNNFKIELIERSDFLAKNIVESDFAIISNGRTVFEVAATKVPMITVAVNQRERNHSFVKQFKMGFSLTLDTKNDDDELKYSIKQMLKFKMRKKFFINLKRQNMLKGTERVNKLILKKINK